MIEQTSGIQNLDPNRFLTIQGGNAPGEPDPAGPQLDPLYMVYYVLLETTNTTCRSALIQAKMMNQNAAAQDSMNKRMGDLKFNGLPTKKMVKHTKGRTKGHTTWRVDPADGSIISVYLSGNKIYFSTCANQSTIDNLIHKNDEVNAKRTFLTNQLNSLQQTAQVETAQINTMADTSSQSTQQASHILDLLTTLTYAALLRKPLS